MSEYKQRLLELAELIRIENGIDGEDGVWIEKYMINYHNKNLDELIFLINKLEQEND